MGPAQTAHLYLEPVKGPCLEPKSVIETDIPQYHRGSYTNSFGLAAESASLLLVEAR